MWTQFEESNTSIWPIERTLSGATTIGQSGPGSNDYEGVLYIYPKALGLEPHHQMALNHNKDTRWCVCMGWGSYPSAEMQPV